MKVQRVCAVCHQFKPVEYCGFCGAWICDSCIHSPRRIEAFLRAKGLTIEGLRRWLSRCG